MKIYTYRYFWKDNEGKLFVKFLTDSQENHKVFQDDILKNQNIVSCMREYVGEVDLSFIGFTEPVKEEKKEENKDETLCEDGQ